MTAAVAAPPATTSQPRSVNGPWDAGGDVRLVATRSPRDRAAAREAGGVGELLFDAQQLVVLGHAVRARRRARLQLPGVDRDGQVRDGRVLCLARAVRDDGPVARRGREPDRVEGLG